MTTTTTITAPNKELVIISLGDGDFTWSLDFIRYLVATISSPVTTTTTTTTSSTTSDDGHHVDDNQTNSLQQQHHEQQRHRWWNSIRFIVSGIDPIHEFQEKYRNYNYVLRELLRLNSSNANDSCQPTIHVYVQHEVNAILTPPSSPSFTSSTSSLPSTYPNGHIVFFHHPHLGVEDAQLHTKFLFHLFFSIQEYWLVKNSDDDKTGSFCSIFYLTLANGQFERWNCYMAAKRHRMKLVQEFIFVSEPEVALHAINATSVNTMNITPQYQHKLMYGQRRHQTGKSFASRTNGSTTYAFVREDDYDRRNTSPTKNDSCFASSTISIPWFMSIDYNVSTVSSNINATNTSTSPYSCSICNKSFREERSLKNHMKSVHEPSHSANSKRRRSFTDDSNVESYVCHHCANGSRKFDTFVALQDHICAKHSGLHTSIQPDWIHHRSTPTALPSTANNLNTPKEEDPDQHSLSTRACDICDATFTSVNDEEAHYKWFIPLTTTGTCGSINDNSNDTNITTSTTATKTATTSKIECRFCFKRFQQIRAQQQHENFCSSRPKLP